MRIFGLSRFWSALFFILVMMCVSLPFLLGRFAAMTQVREMLAKYQMIELGMDKRTVTAILEPYFHAESDQGVYFTRQPAPSELSARDKKYWQRNGHMIEVGFDGNSAVVYRRLWEKVADESSWTERLSTWWKAR